jgi:hypothetical protein
MKKNVIAIAFAALTLCACGAHVRSLRVFLIEAGSQKRLKPVIL